LVCEKVNKFDSVSYKLINDIPVVAEGCAYIICDVISKNETSTHTIFIGKVTDADIITSEEPMTYSYYHKVIKGKSPKNAPTYIPEENENVKADKKKYICSVCGYEYDGEIPFEELPDTYTCPICGQPKSVFEIAD